MFINEPKQIATDTILARKSGESARFLTNNDFFDVKVICHYWKFTITLFASFHYIKTANLASNLI